jgi:regulator of nonsense transcripts 1
VKKVQGKAVQVTPHAQFIATAKITSVVTIGKEELTGAQTSRADLTLDAFKGGDALLATPFVRKIFFPEYPLQKLKWPTLPVTQPKTAVSYRQLNPSQERAMEKSLSNKEEDRLVVIVVSSSSSLSSSCFTVSVRGRQVLARPP